MDSAEVAENRKDALNEARGQQLAPASLNASRYADNYKNNQPQSADNYSEGDHVDRLAEARSRENRHGKISDALNAAKTLKDVATPMGGISLLKQINLLTDMPFVAAGAAALLKDLLDLVTGPTVILAILFSILCTIFIFMMLMLVSSPDNRKTGKKIATKHGKKIIALILGGIADSIPGIDFFPIETITVGVVYFLTLIDRKESEKS